MRIVVDMQGAQTESRFRGIGRYSLSLTQALARNAGAHEIWLAVNARIPNSIPILNQSFSDLIPPERIRIFDIPDYEGHDNWGTFAAERIREHAIASLSPDVVLITSIFEGYASKAATSIGAYSSGLRTAAILYDLIPYLNPKQYLSSVELHEYYHRKIDWLKKADLLLAISEHSRQEAIQHLALPAERVINISAAVETLFRPARPGHTTCQTLLSRLGIQRKMILYTPGGFDPRKNFERLIQAYCDLPKPIRAAHQLVIAGKSPSPEANALARMRKQYGLDERDLVLTGYVQEQELIALYSLAELFVFPSMHEGFGLPVLEAMACGAPVIGSNRTSIPEVIGWDEALFDPLSSDSITRKMAQSLSDETFREELRQHGCRQAKKFTWDACALKTIEALRDLMARETTPRRTFIADTEDRELTKSLAMIRSENAPDDRVLIAAAESIAFNICRREGHLLLDISTLVHTDAKSGIQRVVRSLLRELITRPPAGMNTRPVYFDRGVYRYANRFCKTWLESVADTEDTVLDLCQDDIYVSLDLNMHLTTQVHDTHVHLRDHGIPLNFIVYDLLPAHRPDWWPREIAPMFQAWLAGISEVATGLICISQAVADELTAWLQSNPPHRPDAGPRISSFHLGADVHNSLPSQGLPHSAGRVLAELKARTSFLMVGTLEPRKGHSQTLAAFEQLWRQGIEANLVIVGKQGWQTDELVRKLTNHPERGKHLFWLDGISDEYLESVYAASSCLIAASEGEGFGLPLIEAAQHKCPIIARDIPVFREVAGEHAYYFTGKESEALAGAIRNWLDLHMQNMHPRSDNMPWLTWRDSAEQIKRIVREDA